jgi:hypothetical protein
MMEDVNLYLFMENDNVQVFVVFYTVYSLHCLDIYLFMFSVYNP